MKLSKAERKKIVAKLVTTVAGRQTIAADLINPLRTFRDYETIGRRAFVVDTLADGALPYYDKDPEVSAYTVAEEGDDILDVVKGDRVFVPLREIAANPMIPWTQIKSRKYDVEARVKTKARTELFREEDEMVFNLMEKVAVHADATNPVIVVASASLSVDTFSEAMGNVEAHGNVRAENIFMNAIHMKALRKLGKDYFVPAVSQEILKTGRVGTLFGMQVHTSPVISQGAIYVTSEAEFFGVFTEGYELEVIPVEDSVKRQVGFSVFEQVGCAITASSNLCKISVT